MNNNWIELNLPWYYHEYIELPALPNLSERGKVEFGKLPEDAFEELRLPEDFSGCISHVFSRYDDKEIEFYAIAEKAIGKSRDGDCDYDYEKIDAEVKKMLNDSPDENVQKVLKYKEFKKQYNEWQARQPEYIEWKNIVNSLQKKHNERINKMSFVGLGLAKAGVLVEVEIDGKTAQYLIGDINQIRGVCDDCTAFDNETIVKRYKIIWDKNEEKQKNEGIEQINSLGTTWMDYDFD